MYKLLIADDEYEIRTGLSSYFPWHEIGIEVVNQSENGQEVLEYVSHHKIDIILCDIRMPIKSGIDVARELFELKLPIKVVFLSGYKEFEYAQQAIKYGVKNYILKPTKYQQLVNVFAELKEELDQQNRAVSNDSTHLTPLHFDMEKETAHSDIIIARIKSYVCEHYRNVTLESLSEVVHMNPDYISKYFKHKTGENFSNFVIRIKMYKAVEFLQDINLKTYEISELVGYSNAKNFTRTFSKFFGKSPSEYRKMACTK